MRRQFRFAVIVLGLAIAAATGAAAMREAAGAEAQTEMARQASELRVREAVLRAQVAERAYEQAAARLSAGTGSEQEVNDAELAVLAAHRAVLEAQARAAAAGKGASQRVSLDVSEATLTAALTTLFKGTGQSLILDPAVAQAGQSVTLKLNDVSLESAVRAICKLHGLEYETDNQGLWVITASPDVARVGGAAFPIYGVTSVTPGSSSGTIPHRPGGGSVGLSRMGYESAPRLSYGGQAPAELEGRTDLARIGVSDLVDLDVENAPLGEVAAQLGVRRGEEWQVEILVHDAVPEDITVTAKVYRMRRDDVLLLLAEQTNLDISVDSPMPGERTLERPHTRVYFVPRPELEVSGLGVGGEMTGFGRYEGGVEVAPPDLEARILPAVGRRYEAARSRAEEAQKLAEQLRQEMWVTTDSAGNILRSCRQCGAKYLMPDWKFCPHCGAEVVAEEERPGERPVRP